MRFAPSIGLEPVRLVTASAVLWLACGEAPRDAGGEFRGKGLEPLTLQATDVGKWSTTGSLAQARDSHTATLLPSGKVLIAGGYGPNGYLASMEVYDPVTKNWSPVGSLDGARIWQTATLLPSGKVLLVGGNFNLAPLAIAELYDPATEQCSTTAPLRTARLWHTATLLPSGKVLITGGLGSNGTPLASAEVYDPASGTWTPTGSLAMARHRHTATLLPSGKVLITGGDTQFDRAAPLDSVEVYDPMTGAWSSTSSHLATSRYWHTATLLRSGKVLVTGGHGDSGSLDTTEVYDPSTGAWSQAVSMDAARDTHTATLLPSGKVLVSGGAGWEGLFSSEELYDPDTGQWSKTDYPVESRDNHTATLLPSGKVLVTAGYGLSDVYLANAELYDALEATEPPFVDPIDPQKPGASFEVQGNGFMSPQGDPGIVRLQIFPDGELRDLTAVNFSETSLQLTLDGVPEGHHLLFVLTRDATRDAAGGQILRVDGTPPGVPVVSAPGSFTNRVRPVIDGTAEAGSKVMVVLDGTAVGTALSNERGQWSFTPAMALTEGPHQAVASATDAAGNSGPPSEALGFTVDTLPPETPEVSTPGDFVISQTPAIDGTAEAGSTVEVWLDGSLAGKAVADAAGAWNFTPATALTEGLHWTAASTMDRAGNSSPRSRVRYFAVDSVAPVAPKVRAPGASVFHPRPVIGGTAESGNTVEVSLDGSVLGTTLTDTTGNWSFTPATALELGTHIVFATARDQAGNTSSPSAEYAFLVSPRSHYGWGCATTSALPTTWALLTLAWFLRRRSVPLWKRRAWSSIASASNPRRLAEAAQGTSRGAGDRSIPSRAR